MNIGQMLRRTVVVLAPRYGIDEARWITRELLEGTLNMSRVDLIINSERALTLEQMLRLDKALKRLLADDPLQYILGYEKFMGMKLKVTPDTLIPRPETAALVDIVIDREGNRKDLNVLDVGTGSGCIALALARGLKFASVTGIDISESALAVARENAKIFAPKAHMLHADCLAEDCLDGEEFDIIVSNPPYILESERSDMNANVLDYEPDTALFVPDSDSFRYYNAINRLAMNGRLKRGGRIYFECNPLTVKTLAKQMEDDGWDDVTVLADDRARERFLTAVRP